MPDYIFNNQNKKNENEHSETPKNSFIYPNENQPMEQHQHQHQDQQTSQIVRPQDYAQFSDEEAQSPVYITPKPSFADVNRYSTKIPEYQTQKKAKKSRVIPVVACLCSLCIVLSGLAGFGGALLANEMAEKTDDSVNSNSYSDDDAGVVYRSISTNDRSSDSGKGTIASVAAAVENSVVEIVTEYQNMSSYFQYVTEGAGSGVIITSDGYIVTNNHVIAGSGNGKSVADKITVRLKNGEEYEAKLVGTDSSSDIALLKIETTGLTPVVFGDSDKIIVGEGVVAVGNPLGELGGTVTNGIISALDRAIDVDGTTMNLLQTNAAVNPGNSGGGLFNMYGELIGIVNAKSSGSGIEGLGFAIPSNDVLNIVEQLRNYGYVRGRVLIGVNFVDVTDGFEAQYYQLNSLGVYVASVVEGYNDTVLKSRDRVTAVNGKEITSTTDIKNIIAECEVGDVLKFTIIRDKEQMEVEVTCYELIPEGITPVEFEP